MDQPPPDNVVGYLVSFAASLAASLGVVKKFGARLVAPEMTVSMEAIEEKLDEQTVEMHKQTETLGDICVTLGRYDERLLAMDRRIARLESK